MARITGLLFALAVAGCYSPQLSNPGFYCHPDDNPACPDGQKCQDGRCVALDFQGSTGGDDGGVGGGPTGDDMAMSGGGSHDMAMKPADMSKPVDFSQGPAPDLSGGGSCGAQLDPCTQDTDCCSMLCFPGLGCL
jgi:hypothetical protein